MFNFGQLRKSNTQSYLIDIDYTFDNLKVHGDSSSAVIFTDKVINLSSTPLIANHHYYLNFSIARLVHYPQQLKIYLKNSFDPDLDNMQEIASYTIDAGKLTEILPFELVFTPEESYNQIWFQLQRIIDDYSIDNGDGTYGRKMNIQITNLNEVYDIMNSISPNKLVKIGIQGAPGMLMCINGEEIRIGRSGIYEIIHENLKITSVCLVIKEHDYFVMDYQY